MRIGLVLFGNLRSFRNTLSSFNFLRKTLEQAGTVDVFFHTWDIEESATNSWWKNHKADNPPPPTVNSSEIEEAYRPVKFIIEPSIQFDDSGYKVEASIPVAGILSMLHTQLRAFELLKQYEEENKFRYDVVIKTRFDLLYEIAPEFINSLNNCVKQGCVYLPSSNPYELAEASSDIFAAGSRTEIEKYFSFCSNFRKATEIYFQAGYRQLIPELCMTVYLKQTGVSTRELSGMRLHILRMNNEKFQINCDRNFHNNLPQCFYTETITANLLVLPGEGNIYARNKIRLVKKYMGWIDPDANSNALDQYAEFYIGKWIGIAAIKRLAVRERNSSIFTNGLMKNFFGGALYSAHYGFFKKCRVAFTLLQNTRYGWFYFRLLIRKYFIKGK
jgi:hypothetical protein